MVMTYKKLASLAMALQFPKKAIECQAKVTKILEAAEADGEHEKSEEQLKEELSDQLNFLFTQQVAYQQAQDFESCLKCIK
jgi:hypothetical protein